MHHSTRILIPLAVLVTVSVFVPPAQAPEEPDPRRQREIHALSYEAKRSVPLIGGPSSSAPVEDGTVPELEVTGGGQEARASTDWAAAIFARAGLALPSVAVAFHESDEPCGGFGGRFRPRETPLGIDICNPHRLIILHEFAHAWEHATLTDTEREAYLELRGLQSWNDSNVACQDRGIEDLAQVVVWGLLRFDRSEVPDNRDSRREAFTLIAGIDLSAAEAQDGDTHPSPSTGGAAREPDWDLAH